MVVYIFCDLRNYLSVEITYVLILFYISVPYTVTQCGAALSAGCASCILTNPLDLVRTRVQVQRKPIPETMRLLWQNEKLRIFTKGLTARMTSSVIYSVAIIFGYETVKKWSVHEEYKPKLKWWFIYDMTITFHTDSEKNGKMITGKHRNSCFGNIQSKIIVRNFKNICWSYWCCAII